MKEQGGNETMKIKVNHNLPPHIDEKLSEVENTKECRAFPEQEAQEYKKDKFGNKIYQEPQIDLE